MEVDIVDEVLNYVNMLRTQPFEFLKLYVAWWKDHPFDETETKYQIAPRTFMITNEGRKLVIDSGKVLRDMVKNGTVLPALERHDSLCNSARICATDPKSDHLPNVFEIIDEQCGENLGGGECLAWNYAEPFEIVMQLFVDDGVPSRGHRHLLLKPEFRYLGFHLDVNGRHAPYANKSSIHFTQKKPTRDDSRSLCQNGRRDVHKLLTLYYPNPHEFLLAHAVSSNFNFPSPITQQSLVAFPLGLRNRIQAHSNGIVPDLSISQNVQNSRGGSGGVNCELLQQLKSIEAAPKATGEVVFVKSSLSPDPPLDEIK